MAATYSVALHDPTETSAEVKAAAGFLVGHSGPTREASRSTPYAREIEKRDLNRPGDDWRPRG